jgi:hypothetical protein
MIALAFALYALMFYAVSRVMFDSLEPVAALKESMAATRRNLGAMLLFAGRVLAALRARLPGAVDRAGARLDALGRGGERAGAGRDLRGVPGRVRRERAGARGCVPGA